jgi:hypothetical protein
VSVFRVVRETRSPSQGSETTSSTIPEKSGTNVEDGGSNQVKSMVEQRVDSASSDRGWSGRAIEGSEFVQMEETQDDE